ncbi:MAG: L-threonylcarbamoyladenylate synthase [Alphaproteobacteria bacterium]|nr:L-threonylcarbamoyladenylate synthase [Alphaproteobacteria bacterium]
MAGFGIGQAVRRKEDARFLTGAGCFQDEINLPGQAHAVILRSPHAHAELVSIETMAAAAPGVLAVLMGADVRADGLGTLPSVKDARVEMKRRDGSPAYYPPQPILAQGRVRHVGEPVAMVVAETAARALDAVERIEVEYKPLAAIADTAEAAATGAPQLWPEAPGNVCFDWFAGDKAAVEKVFAAKARPAEKPLIVLVQDLGEAGRYGLLGEDAELLAGAFWPGALTLIVNRRQSCPLCREINPRDATVALRAPGGDIAMRLLRAFAGPLTAPSANRSGAPPPNAAAEVMQGLGSMIDAVLDGGPCAGGESTIIDLTAERPRLLRQGAISRRRIEETLRANRSLV